VKKPFNTAAVLELLGRHYNIVVHIVFIMLCIVFVLACFVTAFFWTCSFIFSFKCLSCTTTACKHCDL